MRTARCVAIHVVPRSSTTPKSSSAPMATARSREDSSEVTYSVACTKMNMAPRVKATIRIVVKAEAIIIFIGLELGRPLSAWRRIAQPNEKQNAEEGSYRAGHQPKHFAAQRKRFEAQRKPDQSSATRMESLGLAASYLMLAGCPATSRSNRTWLSSPVISCAV